MTHELRELLEFLHAHATDDLLPWASQVAASVQFNLSLGQIEERAMEMGLLPARYQRNRHSISLQNQLTLFRSCVAVIGAGGLGGYLIEELARLGVGTIIACDPDVFEEHNLNRQILSSPASLGCAKVEVAAARVAEINPAVTLMPIQTAYSRDNGKDLLQSADVVVDALDSIALRLALADTCAALGIPLVHGAIAGWYGQASTQFPGDNTIEHLYGRWAQGKGAEEQLGNPSFTPAVVASIEAAEVCKILLGVGKALKSRTISINLLEMTFEEIVFESPIDEERPASGSGWYVDDYGVHPITRE